MQSLSPMMHCDPINGNQRVSLSNERCDPNQSKGVYGDRRVCLSPMNVGDPIPSTMQRVCLYDALRSKGTRRSHMHCDQRVCLSPMIEGRVTMVIPSMMRSTASTMHGDRTAILTNQRASPRTKGVRMLSKGVLSPMRRVCSLQCDPWCSRALSNAIEGCALSNELPMHTAIEGCALSARRSKGVLSPTRSKVVLSPIEG